MNNKHFVGENALSLSQHKKPLPVSKVVLWLDDEVCYQAGTDDGTVLESDCPYATQEMANALLNNLKGYQYTPAEIEGSNLSPLAEIGDGVTVGGEYISLAYQNITFANTPVTDFSAPGGDEIDHEYQVEGELKSSIERKTAQTRSLISKTSEEILLKVEGIDGKLGQTLRVAADGVTITNADGDELIIDGGQLKANSINASKIDASELQVSAANITGTLNANQIKMTGSITWSDLSAGVQSTINNAATTGGVSEDQVTVITNNAIATASISANQITTGTLNANSLLLNGLLGLYYGNSLYGYVGATNTGTFAGSVLTDSTANYYFIATNGGARMSAANVSQIYVIAGVNAGCYCTSAMQVASDKRLKNSIQYDLDEFEDVFMSLKPCSYYLNDEEQGKRHWGFVAQDLAESLAESGRNEADFAVLGNDGDHYSIGYTELVPLNTKMIQKLFSEVTSLNRRLSALEGIA